MTPRSHHKWCEVIPQISYLGRFFHFMEDQIEKLHKLDRLTDVVYCHIQNFELCEECKKEEKTATIRNIVVCQQLDQVQHNCKGC
jgi:hypothetical protein